MPILGEIGVDGDKMLVGEMKEGVLVIVGRSSVLLDAAGIEPDVGSGAVIRSCCSSFGVCVPSFAVALAADARTSSSSALVGILCSLLKTDTSMACIVLSADRRSISAGKHTFGLGCFGNKYLTNSLTTETHLTAHAQPRFHHFTDSLVAQNISKIACKGVFQDIQDLQKDDLI